MCRECRERWFQGGAMLLHVLGIVGACYAIRYHARRWERW